MDARDNLAVDGLVHDLNGVFQTISEAADLLAADSRWKALAATLHRTVRQGKRIAGSLQQAVETFDFETVLNSAIESVHDFHAAGSDTELRFLCDFEPGLRLAGRPGAWERVLVNLFLNAARAMGGDGEIEVSALRRNGEIEIVVSDCGPGIAPEILDRVFHPGFSTGGARMGLGLHIVQTIVHEHDGRVAASNRAESQGARFTIHVPL